MCNSNLGLCKRAQQADHKQQPDCLGEGAYSHAYLRKQPISVWSVVSSKPMVKRAVQRLCGEHQRTAKEDKKGTPLDAPPFKSSHHTLCKRALRATWGVQIQQKPHPGSSKFNTLHNGRAQSVSTRVTAGVAVIHDARLPCKKAVSIGALCARRDARAMSLPLRIAAPELGWGGMTGPFGRGEVSVVRRQAGQRGEGDVIGREGSYYSISSARWRRRDGRARSRCRRTDERA